MWWSRSLDTCLHFSKISVDALKLSPARHLLSSSPLCFGGANPSRKLTFLSMLCYYHLHSSTTSPVSKYEKKNLPMRMQLKIWKLANMTGFSERCRPVRASSTVVVATGSDPHADQQVNWISWQWISTPAAASPSFSILLPCAGCCRNLRPFFCN